MTPKLIPSRLSGIVSTMIPADQAVRGAKICLLAALVSINAPAQEKLPDAPGKEVTQKLCGACHGSEVILGKGMIREQWIQVVGNMVSRGMEGTEDEFAEVVEYLTKNFPPIRKINVNKASADALKTALELSPGEAQAIVDYRERNGDFKSVAQLTKVPGIDAGKIEAKQDRLAF